MPTVPSLSTSKAPSLVPNLLKPIYTTAILGLVGSIALATFTFISCGAQNVLLFEGHLTPTATTTPTPGADNNLGVFRMLGNVQTALPFPAHTQGVYFGVFWVEIEHQAHTYDWSSIKNIIDTLPTNTYAQVVIWTGAYGSPMVQNNCTDAQFPTNPIPNCSGWLGAEGVNYVKIYSGGGYGQGNCLELHDPDPTDATYQTEWKSMYSAAINWSATQTWPSGRPKISLLSVTPFSDVGGNLSISTHSTCTTSCPSPGVVSGGQCWYNRVWAQQSGCATNSNPEQCWTNYLSGAFSTLWNYAISVSNGQDLALWVAPSGFANITTDSNADTNITNTLFSYAGAHRPTTGRIFGANEALSNSWSWQTSVNRVPQVMDAWGAQMVSAFTGPSICTPPNCTTQCSNLQAAGTTYGAGATPPTTWQEIYYNDFTNCPAAIQAISQALGGP